ncbi:hypothetical protein C8R45DRAFT_1115730 [Mycena sanguinolenta]|nr:hypothetical protein C8R45DRAFT_1115730 [Mycena sanguinolenta]
MTPPPGTVNWWRLYLFPPVVTPGRGKMSVAEPAAPSQVPNPPKGCLSIMEPHDAARPPAYSTMRRHENQERFIHSICKAGEEKKDDDDGLFRHMLSYRMPTMLLNARRTLASTSRGCEGCVALSFRVAFCALTRAGVASSTLYVARPARFGSAVSSLHDTSDVGAGWYGARIPTRSRRADTTYCDADGRTWTERARKSTPPRANASFAIHRFASTNTLSRRCPNLLHAAAFHRRLATSERRPDRPPAYSTGPHRFVGSGVQLLRTLRSAPDASLG